jgi:hypothetical protein
MIIQDIQENLLVVFFMALFLFYNLFITKDVKALFFIVILLGIFYMLRVQNQKDKRKNTKELSNFINGKEEELSNDSEIQDPKNFRIHKTPRSLKYLKTSPELLRFVYNLRFINLYDKALYDKILSYIEYFMKIHYNMMIGYYDFQTYFPIIKDLRAELLNLLKTAILNLPKQSTILPIDDLDKYMDKKTAFIQALTYKYIKIVYHKYGGSKTNTLNYESPNSYDPNSDDQYNMF